MVARTVILSREDGEGSQPAHWRSFASLRMTAQLDSRVMSFAPIQKSVDDWIQQQTPGYFQPLQMIARLTEELGELARAVSYRFGEKKPKPGEQPDDVADELSDLIFVAVCLANSMQINLDDAWKDLLTKLYQRDAGRWRV